MSEENKVVVSDEIMETKTDENITKENEELEKEFQEKTQKQKLQDILKEREESRKQRKTEEDSMSMVLVEQQDRSINIGVVGSGQAGSRLAEQFYERGYNAVVINTAMQDLKLIHMPERQKLFLDYSMGGAAKDLDTGAAAAEQYKDAIRDHIQNHTEECDILLLAVSGGGGSGSGSTETIVNIMADMGKPISVLYVLPMTSDDSLSKHNALQTLTRLANFAKNDIINSLIIVDNSKIELMFPNKSMADFWKVANKAIVEPLHLFNKLSSSPSEYTSLDPMDFSQLFVGTSDCVLYGMIEVENYLEEESVAEAMITNLESGLLSSDFDIGQTRSAGIIITGSKKVLSEIPAAYIEYGFSMVGKICNDGTRVFRGVYDIDGHPDVLRVYSFFAGLGLPEKKIFELKDEADRHVKALQNKENSRSSSMNIDIGKTQTTSAADAIHKKIMNKNSAMGKLGKNSKRIIDKRRR